MFCKNCGTQNKDNTTYCISCGELLEKIQPNPHQKDNHENQFDDTYKENYGNQFEVNMNTNLPFINRRHNLTKIISVAFSIGIILIAYFIFFGDSGVIYDVQIGAEVNSETYYPDNPLEYVIESSGTLFVSYSTANIQYETIEVQMYYLDANTLVYEDDIYISYENQIGYFSFNHDWTIGEYVILFLLNDEEVYRYSFNVLYE